MSLFAGQERRAEIWGGVVLVVLAAAVVFAIFFAGRIHIGRHVRAQVVFDQVAGLGEGAAVMVAGRKVGSVESISLEGKDVIAYVRIDEGRRDMVPVNGDFFVSSRGVLSERYLEIGPPRDGGAPGRPIADGDRVQGSSPPTLDRAIQRTWDNLEVARAFASDVGPQARAFTTELRALAATIDELDPGVRGWGGLADQWSDAFDQAKTAWATIDQAGADPARLEQLADSAAGTILAARKSLALVRARATLVASAFDRIRAHAATGGAGLDRLRAALADFDRTAAKLDHALAQAQALADAFARGEGSIARLANDPEFPEDAKELGRILKNQPWRVVGHPVDKP
ncbi:MAG TPA: MlaD family protein [Kofleriaceae bacterium]|nr:MlaD family protein [Kofleriaceae bacterium]